MTIAKNNTHLIFLNIHESQTKLFLYILIRDILSTPVYVYIYQTLILKKLLKLIIQFLTQF